LSSWFGGDIAKMGAATSLVYAGGLVLAFVVPAQSVGKMMAVEKHEGGK
jgi:hypothetical protein